MIYNEHQWERAMDWLYRIYETGIPVDRMPDQKKHEHDVREFLAEQQPVLYGRRKILLKVKMDEGLAMPIAEYTQVASAFLNTHKQVNRKIDDYRHKIQAEQREEDQGVYETLFGDEPKGTLTIDDFCGCMRPTRERR